jgi:omega-6 fatty acid desaturase (delta-12 desaturase)
MDHENSASSQIAAPQIAHERRGSLKNPMRSGKELILATKPFAVDSTVKSWWCILSTSFLIVLCMAGTIWNFALPWKIGCSILSGLLILRMFVIYHDQQHKAILPKSRLAGGLMRLYGLFTLSPVSIWTSSHNHHHNHNSRLRGSHIGSFPIMTKAQFLKSSAKERAKYLFMRHPLTILFGYIFVFLGGMCIFPSLEKPKEHSDCVIALVVHVTLLVLITLFLGWGTLILLVLIPFTIAGAIGSYLFYAQHNFPDASFYDSAGWTYEKAALESSSFLATNPAMAWFTANIGYHHIHHLNARIPFYRLPEVMKKLPELQRPKKTSLHPRDIVRCLSLKVWDVGSQRMTGIKLATQEA